MPNISVLCQEFQRLYRTKRTGHKGKCWFTPNWGRLLLPARGHTSLKCIVNPGATCTNQWVITKDRHTWNFLRHFQHPVKWYSFSWSWRAKHTQLITEEYLRTLKNQCSPFKVPNFHSPFQLILLELYSSYKYQKDCSLSLRRNVLSWSITLEYKNQSFLML